MDYTLIIIAGAFTSILTGVVMKIYNLYSKKSKYDLKNERAELEFFRDSIEKRMYELNRKLVTNDERWQDVNHMFLNRKYEKEFSGNTVVLNNFLRSNGVTKADLDVNKRMVFVLTPFNDEFAIDYSVIKETCSQVGLDCIRGDEKYFSTDIFAEMLKYIVKANIIIANINGRNSNVLYELGVAQALGKSVILLSKTPESLPIDIKSKRFLIYRNFSELQENLKLELIKALTH